VAKRYFDVYCEGWQEGWHWALRRYSVSQMTLSLSRWCSEYELTHFKPKVK